MALKEKLFNSKFFGKERDQLATACVRNGMARQRAVDAQRAKEEARAKEAQNDAS